MTEKFWKLYTFEDASICLVLYGLLQYIISYTYLYNISLFSRRDGSLKRYVTYYITTHPELEWLTKIALVEYIGYGNMGCQESKRGDTKLHRFSTKN